VQNGGILPTSQDNLLAPSLRIKQHKKNDTRRLSEIPVRNYLSMFCKISRQCRSHLFCRRCLKSHKWYKVSKGVKANKGIKNGHKTKTTCN